MSSGTDSNISYFVKRQKDLLSIEKEEELNRSTKRFLTVSTKEMRSSVIGSFEVELRVIRCPPELKPQLRVGAPIVLFVKKGETIRGVISKTLAGQTFDAVIKRLDHDILDADKFYCSVSQDSITMKKYFETLEKLEKSHVVQYYCQPIINLAFNPMFLPSHNSCDFEVKKFYNKKLNKSQRNAVQFALSSHDLSLIIGPPGTGKTTTVVELIKQLVIHQKLKVLVAAPSNVAIDHVTHGLISTSPPELLKRLKCCRVGHIARIKTGLVVSHSLTYLVNKQMSQESLRIRKDIEKSLKTLNKTKRIGEKKRIKKSVYHLRKELKRYEMKTIHDILFQSNCVLGTLTGCGNDKMIKSGQYDVVIIDECAQSLEVATWMAILKSKKRVVLVGDPFQLGPTILSSDPKVEKELSISLMERFYKMFGPKVSRMLEIQYRMNEEIMEFPNLSFYQKKLKCGSTEIAERLLMDLDGVEDTDLTSSPLIFIDTSNCGFHESSTSTFSGKEKKGVRDDGSKLNEKEITECLIGHLEGLFDAGVEEKHVGVITFYNGQVQCLKNHLEKKYPNLEISTVDGFQGREKEVIIISFVRSNEEGEVGFLKNSRRINVAITRAKRQLCVIGDAVTLKKNMFLDNFIKHLYNNADVRNADDEYE